MFLLDCTGDMCCGKLSSKRRALRVRLARRSVSLAFPSVPRLPGQLNVKDDVSLSAVAFSWRSLVAGDGARHSRASAPRYPEPYARAQQPTVAHTDEYNEPINALRV